MANLASPLLDLGLTPNMPYKGVFAPFLTVEDRIPTTSDTGERFIGGLWLRRRTNVNADRIFMLVRIQGSGSTAIYTWQELQTGSLAITFTTDNGNAIPMGGVLNVKGGTTQNPDMGVATNINTFADPAGSNNLFIALNNSIWQPDTNAAGTSGLYALGTSGGVAITDNRFMHNFGAAGGADCNTFLGLGAGNFTLTGTNDTGLGCNSLSAITDSVNLTAVGSGSFANTLSASASVAVGTIAGQNMQQSSSLVLVGYSAGRNINTTPVGAAGTRTIAIGAEAIGVGDLTGIENIMIGFQAGENMTSSADNIGIGARSQDEMLTGARNISIGTDSLGAEASGDDNISIGNDSMLVANGASDNIGIGTSSLLALATGLRNIAIGQAGQAITTANDCIAIGDDALNTEDGNGNSIAIGANALETYNSSVGSSEPSIAIGTNALRTADGSNNRMVAIGHTAMETGHGVNSIAVGYEAGATMGLASSCVLLGYRAGYKINTGDLASNDGERSIAIGALAMGNAPLSDAEAYDNIAIGTQALQVIDKSHENVIVGHLGGLAIVDGAHQNTGFGNEVLGNLAGAGIGNLALGHQAGNNYTTTESYNILLGYSVLGTAAESNTLRIGNDTGSAAGELNIAYISGIYSKTLGGADQQDVYVDETNQLAQTSSTRRVKDGIRDMADDSSAVMKLRPVTFHYKKDDLKRLQYGLIAEEVEEILPRLVGYDDDGLPNTVRYSRLPVMLLNELQKMEARLRRLEQVSCTNCGHHVG